MAIFFRIIFYDDDKKTFGVSDIISNDDPINHRTCEMQKKGRHVRVSTGTVLAKKPDLVPSIQSVVKICESEHLGYRFDPQLGW